eukprot:683608-Rhodomonas_salina.1
MLCAGLTRKCVVSAGLTRERRGQGGNDCAGEIDARGEGGSYHAGEIDEREEREEAVASAGLTRERSLRGLGGNDCAGEID